MCGRNMVPSSREHCESGTLRNIVTLEKIPPLNALDSGSVSRKRERDDSGGGIRHRRGRKDVYHRQ